MRPYRFHAALLSCLVLAACGGGGGGGGGDFVEDGPAAGENGETANLDTDIDDPVTQAALRDRLIADYTPLSYTPLVSVPTTGKLRYDGVWGGSLSNRSDAVTDSLLGQLRVDVSFTATSLRVAGSVANLMDAEGAALSGSLALGQGALDRQGDPSSDATLTFVAAGTLRDADGRSLTVDTRAEGDFLTDPYRAIGGEVLGRVTSQGASQSITGSFIAER